MPNRLPNSPAEIFNRSERVTVYYEGRAVSAYEGDTVAAALLGAGVRIFSRSFKYHRPRGPSCLSGQCGRCSMIVDGRPHVRTCQTLVRNGMIIKSQGKTHRDVMAVADKMSGALPTGFYYKAFHKPAWIWPHALKVIRRAPGGHPKVKAVTDRGRFEEAHLTPEILIIGGGPAGLEAALTASRSGVRIVIVESDSGLGGFERYQSGSESAAVKELAKAVASAENVTVLTSTTASAIYPEGIVVCFQSDHGDEFDGRIYVVHPQTTIMATGAMSQPMIFANNDRPGIILPEAAQRMVHLHALRPGRKVLIAGGDDYSGRVALDLIARGVTVAAVADYRQDGFDESLLLDLSAAGIPFLPGHVIVQAKGVTPVRGAELVKLDGLSKRFIHADCLVASAGRTTRHKLLGIAGAGMRYRPEFNLYLPRDLPPGYYAAGRVLGLQDPKAIRAQGRLAAAGALADLGLDTRLMTGEAEEILKGAPGIEPVKEQPRLSVESGKRFFCFCHDVTEKDLESTLREGFRSMEAAKRYSTATMGSCQGAMCEANFARFLSQRKPVEPDKEPLPTPRPMAGPMSLGALASGYHFPARLSPLHRIQEAVGAVPIRIGSWIRVEHFGDPENESLAVHERAGLLDISTLGKFRVFGPDAEKLLDRINTRKVTGLKEGKILYTAACNEEGVLIDDGVIIKKAEDDYFLTTSTARAPVAKQWYARWLREEAWQAWMVDLTDALAAMNLAGPRAREILASLTDSDVGNEALPYMHSTRLEIAGVKALVLRMGFLGELGYEIHCPAGQGLYLWRKLFEAGSSCGLQSVGLETLMVCRLEKGHILPGIDTDGNTSLLEAGLGWLWDRGKEDAVGTPMLRLLESEPGKLEILPFSVDGRTGLKEGHLVVNGDERLGYITSVRYSPILDQTIGLVLIRPDEDVRNRGRLTLYFEGDRMDVRVVRTPFYDPQGGRMKI